MKTISCRQIRLDRVKQAMARLGLDFDNTIACYDQAFHQVAAHHNLVPALPVLSKRQVKAAICRDLGEPKWTWLQGLVYGPEIFLAEPFPGVLDFMRQAVDFGWELCVVSHKTRHPVIGEEWNLHQFASDWLKCKGFFQDCLVPSQVYFETTREAKIARIEALGCQIFVDDLPEVFLEPDFPCRVDRWLHHRGAVEGPWRQFEDWETARNWLK